MELPGRLGDGSVNQAQGFQSAISCMKANTVGPSDEESPKLGTGPETGLQRRKHSTELRLLGTQEWSAWIGAGSQGWHVPLGTIEERAAAKAAKAAAAEVAALGWGRAAARLPREFTLCLYWLEAPVACTYATLFTLPDTAAPPARELQPRVRLALIEQDPVFRAAIAHWLNRLPGVMCKAWEDARSWHAQSRRQGEVDLILVNRLLPAFSGDELRKPGTPAQPAPLVLGYGIYPDSDSIFASVTGVEAGYYFRRRALNTLLEPLSGAMASNRLVVSDLARALRRYFQGVFAGDSAATSAANSSLTARERQILTCLQRGLHDKEIAAELGISPLTVHTHLKHIFEKLDAHTRTEAVVKYLEK
jgi:DNA-binding NarL/FixJ family response regulator